MQNIAEPVSVTVTRLNRALFADLNYFAALHGVRLQAIGRYLITRADLAADFIERGVAMEPQENDVRLQIPAVPRDRLARFYEAVGQGHAQAALRGMFDWLAENAEEVAEALRGGTCD